MRQVFYPESIVVIGVSERSDNLARNIISNLRAFGYAGELYAVGRRAGCVHGVEIAPSLEKLPDGIDLAVMLVPAPLVPELVEACGRKSIQRVVIESGGFGEFSQEGCCLEERLLEIAACYGIRVVGPNCISVINLEAGVCLPFVPLAGESVRRGPASVVAQSGGVSITYMDLLSQSGVGVNKVISMGNKADLDETDYLSYLLQDSGTELICLYLESVGDGRRLLELARTAQKPLVVHKANRGQASQRIAFSHTAALADDDRIVDGALRQAGVVRAESFADAVAVAQGFALPAVEGNEMVVLSRSGGHAVVAADAAERFGFHLPPLPVGFSRQVRELFRADVIAPTNPLDLGAIFDFDLYARVVEECLCALTPHAVLLINTYSRAEVQSARRLAQRVEEIVGQSNRPVALCVYAQADEARIVQQQTGLPVFAQIEAAVRGLAASRDWHRWRARRQEGLPIAPWPPVAAAQPAGEKVAVLTTEQALNLCRACGIPVAAWEVVEDPTQAAGAAARLGYPVALKALSDQIVHKSDVGGVVLNLEDPATVEESARAMWERLGMPAGESAPVRLMVQRMAGEGVEVILGGQRDASFGPVVMFGLGGIHVELFDDASFRVAPLAQADAEEMVDEVQGARLLGGARGRPPVDREALVDALLALSRLLLENPHLIEIDLNPLVVLEKGVVAVDARAMRD